MKDNALAVANYFVELAKNEGKPITLLGLVKRVYIAHGFSLAIHNKSLLDPRFDVVEAWKYGPVIPSVYHSFKQYKAEPITEKTFVVSWDEKESKYHTETPELRDEDSRRVVRAVWSRYMGKTDSEMVTITHQEGTPWERCYIAGMNCVIPDDLTRDFYRAMVQVIMRRKKEREHEQR